eukprot:3996021-Ditylum_brightwellii.AAC.1
MKYKNRPSPCRNQSGQVAHVIYVLVYEDKPAIVGRDSHTAHSPLKATKQKHNQTCQRWKELPAIRHILKL